MAIHLCVSGFGKDWDGTYENTDRDHYAKMPDHDYWIYRDSWYWFISVSAYLYHGEGRRLAQKAVDTYIFDPTGSYEGVYGEPNGTVSLGDCP